MPPARRQPPGSPTALAAAVAGAELTAAERERIHQLTRRSAQSTESPPPLERIVIVGDQPAVRAAAAEAWAHDLARPLQRIDLAHARTGMVEETERTLDQVLDRARESRAILVLDEADALFGQAGDPAGADAAVADATVLAVLRHSLDHYAGPIAFGTARRPDADQLEAGRIGAVVELGVARPFPSPGSETQTRAGPAQRRDLRLIRQILQQVETLPPQPGGQRLALPGENPDRVDFHLALLMEAGLVRGTLHRSGADEPAVALVERLTWSGHDALALLGPAGTWRDACNAVLDTEGRGEFAGVIDWLRRRRASTPPPSEG